MADLSVEILKQIRDEVRVTRTELSSRIDATNERLDATNERLDRLERRQTETEIRLATELVATVGAINELRDVVVQAIGHGKQVADHEHRIRALEQKVG
jgi:archaellum component FlaC